MLGYSVKQFYEWRRRRLRAAIAMTTSATASENAVAA
jgi:hypothetical protein